MKTAKQSDNNKFVDGLGLPLPSDDLVDAVREICDNKILLAFSGKDSLAVWLWLRELNFEIYPYTTISFPGFIVREESLEYYENFFGTKIIRALEPDVYGDLRKLRFQSPDRIAALRSFSYPRANYDDADLENEIAAQEGLPQNYVSAIGYRSSDGVGRRSFIRHNGAVILKKRRLWFAIHDWKQERVMEIIRKYDVRLSREYDYFGSTSDALDPLFCRILYNRFPEEYKNLKKLYPLVGVLPIRYFYVK